MQVDLVERYNFVARLYILWFDQRKRRNRSESGPLWLYYKRQPYCTALSLNINISYENNLQERR